ncbi:putative membrane protein [Paenibacillus sp. SORGH_AS306]|uniref:hypothetical protein n=1 Tax=unclassified Paenibacillus TaxID=185978 RepID=UPI00277FCAFC|nr:MULTISPECIES: hypothetical protein [unclassified Paenibacillus]MDQ1236711.1 putative membrane protein [Paenibacillus sp. SORGH_AS_0306]MDR6109068.1 putative membrane protein [Paenibacillus sp. SORGH_AS_0338]
MEAIVYAYREKSVTSILTLIAAVVGVCTILFFQTLTVQNLSAFVELTSDGKTQIFSEWAMNLISGFYLMAMAWSWIKAVFDNDTYWYRDESNQVVSKVVYTLMAVCCLAFGAFFFQYIFTKLIFLVIVAGLVWLYASSKK